MDIVANVVSVVLALGMLASGSLKILRNERIVGLMAAVGVPERVLPVLGALQVAATIGLIAGLRFTPLGIAAAAGLVLYFAGAVGAHVRAHDPEWQAALFLVISAGTLVLLVVNA